MNAKAQRVKEDDANLLAWAGMKILAEVLHPSVHPRHRAKHNHPVHAAAPRLRSAATGNPLDDVALHADRG